MKNIVKSQFYQIIREKMLWYMLVVALMMQTLMFVLPVWLENEEATSAGEFFAGNGYGLIVFPVFFLVVAVGLICGVDFLDKTNHYEVLGGHRRYEVYLGRVIASSIAGGVGALFLTILPVGIYAVLYGWGEKVAFAPVILRFLLMLFPYLRLVAEFAFLTFLIKNPYVVMGLGYVVFMLTMTIVSGTTIEATSAFLGITNLSLLTMVSKWATYGLGNDMNYIFDASLGAGAIAATVAASVVFGAAALYLGYVFFKHDDMN